jgi:hypothetical protein
VYIFEGVLEAEEEDELGVLTALLYDTSDVVVGAF